MSLNGFLPDRLQRSMQNSDRSNYMLECPTELIGLCESSFFYCSSAVSSSTRMIPKVANNIGWTKRNRFLIHVRVQRQFEESK